MRCCYFRNLITTSIRPCNNTEVSHQKNQLVVLSIGVLDSMGPVLVNEETSL